MFKRRKKPEVSLRLRWQKLGGAHNSPYVRGLRGESGTLVGNRIYFFGGMWNAFEAVLTLNPFGWREVFCDVEERSDHVAGLVDDKIYIYGGAGSGFYDCFLDEIIEYDIINGDFREIECDNAVVGKRSSASMVYASWRRELIVFGGVTNVDRFAEHTMNDTAAFDVDRKCWRQIPIKGQVPHARAGHAAVLVSTNMYIYGGYTTEEQFLNDLWVADLRVNGPETWSTVRAVGNTPVGRAIPCFDRMRDLLILYGGFTRQANVERNLCVFNIRDKEWKRASTHEGIEVIGKKPRSALKHNGIKVSDGIVYVTPTGVFKLQMD